MTSTETAVSLMRMALALLEREREEDVAAHLRTAIEVATGGALTATRRADQPLSRRAEADGNGYSAPMRLWQPPI